MQLDEKIIKIPPREKSGSRTGKKYDYQTHWALCQVLDLHRTADDYLVILEYHDDVVILDSPRTPSRVSFYQLKTAESQKGVPKWTISKLLYQPSGKNGRKNSILGKLYVNKINFDTETSVLCFVSNSPFDLELEDKSTDSIQKPEISCHELSESLINRIKESIKKEHSLGSHPEIENILLFQVSRLTPDYQEELTRDFISKFIEEQFPGRTYQISPIYKTLIGELTRRRNYDKDLTSFTDLIKRKGMTRRDLDDFLQIIIKHDISFKELGTRIENDLKAEGATVSQLRSLRESWRMLEILQLKKDNELIVKIKGRIRWIIDELHNKNELANTYLECKDQVLSEYDMNPIRQSSIEKALIEAMVLELLYVS